MLLGMTRSSSLTSVIYENPVKPDSQHNNKNVTSCNLASSTHQVLRLHERMGHASTEMMCQAIQNGAWRNTRLTPKQVRNSMKKDICIPCTLSKKNKPHTRDPPGDHHASINVGELISGDIIGKIDPPTRHGDVYFFLFADAKTGFLCAYTSKTKDGFVSALRMTLDLFRGYGHQVKYFRSDSETIMRNGDVIRLLRDPIYNVKSEYSLPYAHYQNLVERHVQTVTKSVSTLLHGQAFLSAKFWDYALYYTIDHRNATPNTKTRGRTPRQLVTGENYIDLDRQFLFTFGEPVIVKSTDRNWKFDVKNDIGIYLGAPDNVINGGWIYYPYTKQVSVRANITEARIPTEAITRYYARRYEIKTKSPAAELTGLLSTMRVEADDQSQSVEFTVISDDASENSHHSPDDIQSDESTIKARNPAIDDSIQNPVEKLPMNAIALLQKHFNLKKEDLNKILSDKKNNAVAQRKRKRSYITPSDRTTRSMDRITRSMSRRSAIAANIATTSRLTVRQALQSPERDQWIAALKSEVHSLLHETKTLVPEIIDPNLDHNLIHSTMNLKRKMKDVITIDKYKARCCACGNELTSKGNYENETFSPTASQLTHSTLLQLAIYDRMCMTTCDTVGAYLYQEYPSSLKPLYLTLPKLVAEVCGLNPDTTYRVRKYLYGLPDAGRAYYIAYTNHLISAGYTQTSSDPCLFMSLDERRGMRTYIWFHVDDTFIASTHPEEIDKFKTCLMSKFNITSSNTEVSGHLGINYEHLTSGAIKLSQQKLLGEIFKEYPPSGKILQQPFRPKPRTKNPTVDEPVEQREYLHLLGMLMYMTHSRPDIQTALSYASTKNTNPTKRDFQALLDIVDYLDNTSDLGSTIHPSAEGNSPLKLVCHVDASYLAHEDARSHTGYCLSFGSIGTFYSKSQKQKLVATSSTHAEIRALYTLVLDVIYVVNLCLEIGRPIELPVIVFEDNQPVIDLSKTLNGKVTRSKHFLMLVNFIREKAEEGLIELRKIATEYNTADVLTKALLGQAFKSKALKLLGAIGFKITNSDDQNCSEPVRE